MTTNGVAEDLVDRALFDGLATDAKALRQENNEMRSQSDEYGDPAATEVLLKRIQRNSEQLAGVLRRNELTATKDTFGAWTELKIDRENDLLILRKAWEVGIDSIVIQTVAQVDGDIVTRIQRRTQARRTTRCTLCT